MTMPACQVPLTWETLLAYWLGELDANAEAQAEEHYLGCSQCSHRLEQLAALARGVQTLARNSSLNMVVDDEFVRRLRKEGRNVQEYRLPLNGSVNCTVTPENEFVIGRLEAPLAGVQRVDMLMKFDFDETEHRQEDVLFVADSGAVVYAPSIDALRALPAFILSVRLLAVDERGEHTLGEYTFNHTPYSS